MIDPGEKADSDYESTDVYVGEDTTIVYDSDGDQHVYVNEE